MTRVNRRNFTTAFLAAAAASALPGYARAHRVAIIGGGTAGAAAALMLKQRNPAVDVLLIERDPSRLRPAAPAAFDQLPSGVDAKTLRRSGVHIALDQATEIDWRASRIELFSGRREAFDRVILAPGFSPVNEDIPGLDARTRHYWPAAWGNAQEAKRLRGQLAAMPEAGHIVLRLPSAVSHPEVAQRRIIALSNWLRQHRPSARMTVLDGTADTQLESAFAAAVSGTQITWQRGSVRAIDMAGGYMETNQGRLSADVVNFVAPQSAGPLATRAGLTDPSGWCPCTGLGRSLLEPSATIIGDAVLGAQRTTSGAFRMAEQAVV